MQTLATASMASTYDPSSNLERALALVEEAAGHGARLLALPEQCLQGYLPSLTRYDLEHTSYQVANAERLSDGEALHAIADAARRHDIHVVVGFTERDEWRPEVLFNSAALVGPSGILGSYRKVHQPGDEKHIYHPGENFRVFSTPIGRIGLLICYDLVFPESTRALALARADYLVMPTAWAVADTEVPPEQDRMSEYLTMFGRIRALENQSWFISSNMIGTLGDFTYPGLSQIVAPDGAVRASTGASPGLAVLTADTTAEATHARTVGYLGYQFLKDHRPQIPADVV
ncbi:carbon-nitrogen hydrolase family protein [Litorihabitans aurantiacus]|uniref:Apolipoprotein N-acyltransferase n=1 Tax=Litorihabitans aurantiacus TaxID=1930061 RepID=A0AA37XH40_9MICO|nr:carbon-nitrogen hydrolase family protein [Litorihabitans aurantiacus]GMA33150.1 apolipoprotein N-acyltransferase [Litorihabitans aurantiacus]